MKYSHIFLASFALTVFAQAQLPDAPSGGNAIRTWTSTDGKAIEASLVEAKESGVLLQLQNGKRYDVPFEKLSPEDIAWVEGLAAAAASAEQAAAGLAFDPLLATTGEILFEDDLSEIREGWASGNGDWKSEEGALIGKERVEDDHAATFKRALPFKDAVIQFSIKLDGAKSTTFSIDNATGHLCRVSVNAAGITAQKDDNDKDKGPDEGARYNAVERKLADGEWHTVMIELVGDTFLAQVDGEEDDVSFGSHEMFAGEKMKLGFTISGESAQFKDFRVWEALPKEGWEEIRAGLD
tara:strand:+ start:552 stop:1439 length:888 start_codon:yes stop_codon:yes gene_type:complete